MSINKPLCGIIQAETNTDFINYPLSSCQENKKITLLNIGNIVFINNRYYIITCYHCVKNTLNITIQIKDNRYKCYLEYFSDEFDLALLIINEYKGDHIIKPDDFVTDLTGKSYIKGLDISTFQRHKKIKDKIYNCKEINLITNNSVHTSNVSYNLPKIPYISVQIQEDIDDIHELQGISGSFLMNKNKKILGIINRVENSSIHAISTSTIQRFINEIEKTGNFKGICTLVGRYASCEYVPDHESQRKGNALYVEDCMDINYNNYNYNDNNTYMNIRNGDLIIEVNGHKIDDHGMIDGSNIDMQTYIAMNFFCGSIIPLKILRCKNNNNDYKEKKINIRARPLSSMKYISVSFNKLYNYHGLILVELSEDMINYYRDIGVTIGYSFRKNYIDNPYRNNLDEKIIVLINLDKKNLNKKTTEKINKLGLPLIKIEKDYTLAVLNKVNKKKINNVDELINIVKDNRDNTLYFSINDREKFKIEIKNDKIKDLK